MGTLYNGQTSQLVISVSRPRSVA